MAPEEHVFFHIIQTLAATPEAIFDAWVTPELMRRWMFVTDGNEIYKAQADLRVGGSWSVLEWTGTEHIDHFGHYTAVARPQKLAFSLQAPKHFSARTQVEVRIEADPQGSRMIFNQQGVSASVVEKPWRRMFNELAAVVGDHRGAEARHVEIV